MNIFTRFKNWITKNGGTATYTTTDKAFLEAMGIDPAGSKAAISEENKIKCWKVMSETTGKLP